MALQNRAFKNCKKLMPPHKERESSLDKCLCLSYKYNLAKTQQIFHEIPPYTYKMRVQV